MKRFAIASLTCILLVGVLWPSFRAHRVAAFRQGLLDHDASTQASGVPIQGRFYRSGELQTAGAAAVAGEGAPPRAERPPFNDPVAAIADFRDRLAERGVDLWVMPAPVRPWVAPAEVGGSRLTPWIYGDAHQSFIDALRDEGITAIDLLPPLRRRAAWDPDAYVHRTDPHWTSDGVVMVAELLAERIRAQPWFDPTREVPTYTLWREVKREASAGGIQLPDEPDETIRVRRVREGVEGEGKGKSVRVDYPDAQILVMGDSHARWYDRYGADIARQLSYETGVKIDALAIVGGGSTRVREELARRAWADEDYLPNKKVVIWVFWSEILWSQPWGIVPLRPFEASKLERRGRESRVSSDLHIVELGRGLAAWDYRWRPPEPGDEDGEVAWIRKQEDATMSFPGDVPEGASLILEVRAKHRHPVRATFDGEALAPLVAGAGLTRMRWPLTGSTQDSHSVTIQIEPKPRPSNSLGIRNAVLVTSRLVFAEPFDPPFDPAYFSEGFRDGDATYPTSQGSVTQEVRLPALSGGAIVRARLRAVGADVHIGLRVNDTWVLSDRPVHTSWAEHAVEVPADVLVEGENTLEWHVDGEATIAWDVVEIDAR